MDYLRYSTRNGVRPDRKPRVYLTCHPEDVVRWLDPSIIALHTASDCAVYFAADMASSFEGEDWQLDLGRMQLFVVPVTFKLLMEQNRAMDVDIPFALERKIPILPIMVEPGLDGFYEQRFGEIQFLSPEGDGRGGGVAYEERLKQYLESVLIGEEEARRIREAFDAYVFLSYRKVDRRLADDLMRTVHADPRCRDIAIWYDEFLTPGESFRANIDRALSDSRLFALLVTPNVVEKPGGKPNFVMGVEYPAARNAGLEVVAAEAEATDADELASSFEGLPEPYPLWDEESKARLIDAIARCATEANNADPLHNYLVGLAYLKGIDVEQNAERGVELITSAAEAGLPEAMERLADMYHDGDGVKLNYREAATWVERVYEHRKATLGENDPETLYALYALSSCYNDLGEDQKAAELAEEAWRLCREIFGESAPDTLTALSSYASSCAGIGDTQRAVELAEQAWRLGKETLGETSRNTLAYLQTLAYCKGQNGELQEAADLCEEALRLRRETFGENDPETLHSLNNYAIAVARLGDYERALEIGEEAWRRRCQVLGETHPNTLNSLNNLADFHDDLANHLDESEHFRRVEHYRKAAELKERAWVLRRDMLGETHPSTLASMSDYADYLSTLGEHRTAITLGEEVWRLTRDVLGETHRFTLGTLILLAGYHHARGDYEMAVEVGEKCLQRCRAAWGDSDPDTLRAIEIVARYRNLNRDFQEAVDLEEEAYQRRRETLGENDPDTIAARERLEDYRRDVREHLIEAGPIGKFVKKVERFFERF
ncbi:MAG: tetratricopeptide repeat protein [Coriobacteriaceae bacterium]|nr:tetratricopeptide repeat protein [Coriobacteriaceae bacterium]